MNERAKERMQQILEQQIDQSTLKEVLEALAVICAEKCEHVHHNWQDDALAGLWQDAARNLEVLADKTPV